MIVANVIRSGQQPIPVHVVIHSGAEITVDHGIGCGRSCYRQRKHGPQGHVSKSVHAEFSSRSQSYTCMCGGGGRNRSSESKAKRELQLAWSSWLEGGREAAARTPGAH